MKRSVTGVVAVSGAMALVATMVTSASAQVDLGPLETISSEVSDDNQAVWWSPIDEFDGDTYLAYDVEVPSDPDGVHSVVVTRRDAAGELRSGCVSNTAGGACAEFEKEPDTTQGHKVPSLAVDGDGYIHVFTSMHNDGWQYFRSVRPQDPTEFVDASAGMPDGQLRITYPVITRGPNGDLWLIVRSRGESNARAGARLYHWDNADRAWSLIAGQSFAYQGSPSDGLPQRTVYPDDVEVTPDGDVHIILEWAHEATGIRHEASYLRYRPSEDSFSTVDGNAVTVPVTTRTPGLIYQPLESGEHYGGDAGVQGAKLAMDTTGDTPVPTVAYRYSRPAAPEAFEIRRATFVNGEWIRDTVYSGPSETSATVDISHQGDTELIYYVLREAGGTAYVAEDTGGGEWTGTELSGGNPVQRLAVATDPGGTDLAYLSAHTAISPTRGELYLRTIGR